MFDSGDYVHSLLNYERALSCGDDVGGGSEHQRICQSGVARSAIGSGDIRKGIALAMKSSDQTLMKQCAALLEDNKVIVFFTYFFYIIIIFLNSGRV